MSIMHSDEHANDAAQQLNAGFTELMGLYIEELSADRVQAKLEITPAHHQPFGIVHGGVYCAMVETVASIGAGIWFGDRGTVVGVSNQTDFLKALHTGTVTATATPIHRGRSQQLWLVEITDDEKRLIARGQVRLQNLSS